MSATLQDFETLVHRLDFHDLFRESQSSAPLTRKDLTDELPSYSFNLQRQLYVVVCRMHNIHVNEEANLIRKNEASGVTTATTKKLAMISLNGQ